MTSMITTLMLIVFLYQKGYHNLLQKQRTEMEVSETEIDQHELQEVDTLKQVIQTYCT